jgi:hypothetical protein
LQGEQHHQQKIPVLVEVDSYESEPCVVDDSLNLPMVLSMILQTMCHMTRCQPGRAFITSLQSVVIPTYWRAPKQDSKWHDVMLKEMAALEKNKTSELA